MNSNKYDTSKTELSTTRKAAEEVIHQQKSKKLIACRRSMHVLCEVIRYGVRRSSSFESSIVLQVGISIIENCWDCILMDVCMHS